MNAQVMHSRTAPATTTRPAFGTVMASAMAVATYQDGKWSAHELRKYGPIEMSPGRARAALRQHLFEGFKAYRWADGSVNVFRMDSHIARMRQSARVPRDAGARSGAARDDGHGGRRPGAQRSARGAGRAVPAPDAVRPGALASAAPRRRRSEAMLIVLASPVWDYFAAGPKALRIYVEEKATRCASPYGPGQGRRQLRGGDRADDGGAPEAPGGPGRVLPGRRRPGDRRREFPADPRRQDPDPQPRHDSSCTA